MFVTVGSGILSVNNSGTDVVLTRFPDAGKDLKAFGLTPSAIKSIALPNDLQEWPSSALNGCTALEKITVFGSELPEPLSSIVLSEDHFIDCTTLKTIQIPSCVGGFADVSLHLMPTSLESVTFPNNFTRLGLRTFRETQIKSLDLSNTRLTHITNRAFDKCHSLCVVQLPPCLEVIEDASFFSSSLGAICIPASVNTVRSVAFAGNNPLVVIWQGERAQTVAADAFDLRDPASVTEIVLHGSV